MKKSLQHAKKFEANTHAEGFVATRMVMAGCDFGGGRMVSVAPGIAGIRGGVGWKRIK